MSLDYKKVIIGGILLFTLGLGTGKYISTNKTESSKTETTTETQKEIVDRETKHPDGTIEKERIIRDVKIKTIEKERLVSIEAAKPSWNVSALAGYSVNESKLIYGLVVQKRIAGPIYVGGWGTTEKTIGLSVGYEF